MLLTLTAVFAANAGEEETSQAEKVSIEVTIDAAKMGPPINPFIYGQFIEHLGRCIYGGIWAEMLEDRKFYFPITAEYKPYRSLAETEFPVVGASPWEIIGPPDSVMMVKEDAFVGEHSPRIAAGSGIRQNDLSFVKGKTYLLYAWLKPEGKPKVAIRLGTHEDEFAVSMNPLTSSTGKYVKIPFDFTATNTTDQGTLTIDVTGAPCRVGAVSLMPADNVRGMRADTLALLKQLNATMYRWPGGNFVSGYDWRDGTGERDRRPPRKNPAWTGVEHNDFGIDEFIDFCREVGAEPMIAVNTGFGDDYSAAQEVEYTNGSAETIGGGWRVKNGHAEPYNVRYWCVGNEMWGNWQLGYMQLSHYTQKHNRVAAAMRKVDPNVVLVGSGDLGTRAKLGSGKEERQVSWSEGMLQECGDSMDLISEHFYAGAVPWTNEPRAPVDRHVSLLRDPIRSKAAAHRELQKKLGRKPDQLIPIAMDEWNYWHRDYVYGELGCQYDLADALGVAAGLHEYFRNSDMIHMAHYAQTVNVIGCIKTTKTAAFFDATALPLLLYRREFGSIPLAIDGNLNNATIDVAAAKTADGRAITIGVVNPQATPQAIKLHIDGANLGDGAALWRIAGDRPTLINTTDAQPLVIDEQKDVPFSGEIVAPAYSVNVYRLPVE
jgi:alpha-N-arabinofuranosidase